MFVKFKVEIPVADATNLFRLTNTPKTLGKPELNLTTMLESDFQSEDATDDLEAAIIRHLYD